MFIRIFLLILSCVQVSQIFSQQQALYRQKIPNTNHSFYYTEFPLAGTDSSSTKELSIAPSFRYDSLKKTVVISGFDLFTKNAGNCFYRDTLTFEMDNDSTVQLISFNSKLCNQPISGSYKLSKEDFYKICAADIRKIYLRNASTQEKITFIPKGRKYYFTEIEQVLESGLVIQKN